MVRPSWASNLWYRDIPAIPDFKFGYWKSQAQYLKKILSTTDISRPNTIAGMQRRRASKFKARSIHFMHIIAY
jgi:hypothetical protein